MCLFPLEKSRVIYQLVLSLFTHTFTIIDDVWRCGMDKAWVDKKNQEYADKINAYKESLLEYVKNIKYIDEKTREDAVEAYEYGCYETVGYLLNRAYFSYFQNREKVEAEAKQLKQINEHIEDIRTYRVEKEKIYDICLDSEPVEFDGDIIITDPSYILKKMLERNHWERCGHGSNMEVFGFTKYITHDTICGDWSCCTYNTDTGEVIGHFSADAGMVGVFLLKEVLKYNPDFDYHIKKTWTTTWIRNFKGTVRVIVKEEPYEHKEDWMYFMDYVVEIVGHGINKETGEPINFVGNQAMENEE